MADLDPLDEVDADELDEIFNAAATYLAQQLGTDPRCVPDDLKLQLYGLYKQATAGRCTTAKPGFFDVAGKMKWQAWSKLGGMPSSTAKEEYVKKIKLQFPAWEASLDDPAAKRGNTGTFGPAVSVMVYEDEEEVDSSSLIQVSGDGDLTAVQRLLDSGADINSVDESCCTALHFAADRGEVEVAKLLVSRGADVDARDDEGQTPLHYAAVCGNEEVCRFLLEAGANPGIADASGQTPKQVAPADWSCWEAS